MAPVGWEAFTTGERWGSSVNLGMFDLLYAAHCFDGRLKQEAERRPRGRVGREKG